MILRIVCAVFALVFSLSAFADARFIIERIDVRNVQRIAPQLIVAESLLREGSEVSEDDVRAAVRRVARLPFVFEADYTIEPGSDATRRIVAIDIEENARFWFLADARGIVLHEPTESTDYDYVDPSAEWKHAAAGVRWLFGDGGIAHFGMTVLRTRSGYRKNYSAYELGYTRHHIAGTRLFATAIVRSPVDSLEERTFTPELIVGMPLSANQTLTLGWEDTSFRNTTLRLANTDFRRLHFEREYSAAWTFDTRDDSYAPTRGAFLRVEPFYWMNDFASVSSARPPGLFESRAIHSNAVGVDAAAERHWQLSEASSLSGGLEAGWTSIRNRETPDRPGDDLRFRPTYEVIKGGYARRIGGSWAELEGRVMLRQANTNERSPSLDAFTGTSYEIAAAWARRNPRATLRLGFAYTNR